MSCSAFISEIVHGPRIPHIVSLTRRRAGRAGRGEAARRTVRSDAVAPRSTRSGRAGRRPWAAAGSDHGRPTRHAGATARALQRRTNAEQPPRSQIARPRPRVGRRLTYRLHAPRDTHTAQAHTSRPARPRDLQPVRTVAPLPKHAHECPCML